MPDRRNEIEIRLNTIEELFGEPAADPFDPQSRYQSGIDEIAQQPRLMWRPQLTRLLIRLPGEAMEPDLPGRTKAALERYCAAKVRENQQAITETRHQGRWGFISALIIAGVVLWDPIWTYTYAWRPYRCERQLYEKLQAVELLIEAQA